MLSNGYADGHAHDEDDDADDDDGDCGTVGDLHVHTPTPYSMLSVSSSVSSAVASTHLVALAGFRVCCLFGRRLCIQILN